MELASGLGAVNIWFPLIRTAILLERYAFADKLRLRGSAKLGLKTSKCQLGFELDCDWKTRPLPLGTCSGGMGEESALWPISTSASRRLWGHGTEWEGREVALEEEHFLPSWYSGWY